MIEILEERLLQLENNEEAYKKAFELLQDLIPQSIEQIDDLEGLIEEINFILRSLNEKIC